MGRYGLASLMIPVLLLAFSPSLPARQEDSKSLINPLRKYHEFRPLRPFTPELQALTDQLIKEGYVTDAAVYFRSLNDGVWIGINEKNRFAPASLMKVPIMMVWLKQAEKDPAILKKKLKAETEDNHNQFIPPGDTLKSGEEYTVEELIAAMIRNSDNDAMLTLVKHAEVEEVLKMYDQLGYSAFKEQGDFISLKAYVGTFRVLYNATFLNEEMSEKALAWLSGSKFKKGLAASVPQGTAVAHKFGEYGVPGRGVKQLHDVGIIYHEDNPYLLGIMTRGTDYDRMAAALEKISSFIYNEVDRQYKGHEQASFQYKFEDEA